MIRAKKQLLSQTLNSHFNTIHETFQILEQTPASSLDKVTWNEVMQMGEQVSKQATIVGMLWTGKTTEVGALEENMASYFNLLQGFLLLSHGSTVGAGPTLCSNIHRSVKQVVDSSFRLWMESVSSYESYNTDQKLSIPQLVGTVWHACSALKKIPSTNITAIGRAMTQVAVSMKDVLREMKELKPASSDQTDETSNEASNKKKSILENDDNSSENDLGNDLSPEGMKIVASVISVITEILTVVKELLRCITGLVKQEDANKSSNFVDSLEKLLNLCQGIGAQVDELGACLYPPQEFPAIKAASEKISSSIDELQTQIENLGGTTETFIQACNALRSSLGQLNSILGDSSTADILPEIQNLAVTD